MKDSKNEVPGVSKNKNEKQFNFKDIRRVCKSASKELGDYCKVDSLKSRRVGN